MNKKPTYTNKLEKFAANPLGRLFIVKIVKARPHGVELANWVELIFGLHERDIIQYESNRTFVVPGFYKPVPQIRLSGYKIQRSIPKKQRVWVRFDAKYPNVIDLEAPIAHANEPRVFQLNLEQWSHIRMWLNPVYQNDRLFHEVDCEKNKVLQTLRRG